MRYYTDIICQRCRFKYVLPTTERARLDLMLRYAICPHCGTPRTPEGNPRVPHCSRCYLPKSLFNKFIVGEDLCVGCYYYRKRNEPNLMRKHITLIVVQ